ncbi:MAG: hypothetical protein LZ172_05190 [Thaumarchaeota archaeon]|jgi:hypothetical protein|nr:hypothetical protein [Candidatus Geocrenenecus arthurdayi]MCL7403723.1 hypothetical protein [Candidatus Geocrenenecus arthurdayi]
MNKAKLGISYLVSVAIMTAVTIALGLFLWGIIGGWAGVSALDIVEETNKGVAQQRSLLIVEFVDLQRKIVWVSNPGKVDLVILSCSVYPKNSNPPSREFKEVKKIEASMKKLHQLGSNDCSFIGSLNPSEPYIVEIYAIASTIYNPSNIMENIQWAIMVRSDA